MTINIFQEATKISNQLNKSKINWAFVGGIAVGIYGFIRATEDIDIIIIENELQKIDKILIKEGFVINNSPMEFSDGFKCHRRLKFFDEGNYFILDLLMHPTESSRILSNKIKGQFNQQDAFIVSKDDLIKMKQKANPTKDQIDVENLKNESPFNKDFTPAIERILALTEMIHEMRRGFAFTKDDTYSKKRELFIEYWRDLEIKMPMIFLINLIFLIFNSNGDCI